MSTRIYVDANIYLDYLEERTDRIRPLDEFAFKIFRRALECEFEIVISDAIWHFSSFSDILKAKLPEQI